MPKSRIVGLLAILYCMIPFFTAQAQEEFPKHEFFGGFTYHTIMWGGQRMGWHLSGTRNLHRYFGISSDFASLRSSSEDVSEFLVLNTKSRRYLFLAGPRLRNPNFNRLIPSLHFLAGVAHMSNSYSLSTLDSSLQSSGSDKKNAFAFEIGGSFDYRIKGPFLLRIIEANYIRVKTHSGIGDESGSISCGLVWQRGKKQ
jgi:hypothetical protein